jgi:hypothetical protein
MRPLVVMASIFIFLASVANAELEISCESIVGQISIRSPSKQVVELANKILDQVQLVDSSLIQFQIFKLIEADFKNLIGDSQKALVYFHTEGGINSVTAHTASLNSDTMTMQNRIEKIRKILTPGFWNKIFKMSESAQKRKLSELAAEIQVCRARTLPCAKVIEEKTAPLNEHILYVKRLQTEIDSSSALIEDTLKYLSGERLNQDQAASVGKATTNLLAEFKMTSALLSAHLKVIDQEIQAANISLETSTSLRPLIASVVALGAPVEIFETTKSASTIEIFDDGVGKRSANKKLVDKINNLLDSDYIGTEAAVKRSLPLLQRLAEDKSIGSTIVLSQLLHKGWIATQVEEIIFQRSTNDDTLPIVIELLTKRNQFDTETYRNRIAAFVLLSLNPSRDATAMLIDSLVKQNGAGLELLDQIWLSRALAGRNYTNENLSDLGILTPNFTGSPIPWVLLDVIERVGTPEALQKLKDIKEGKVGFISNVSGSRSLTGYSERARVAYERLKQKLDIDTPAKFLKKAKGTSWEL